MSDSHLPVAIVGAGFSGTMTALHLLARTTVRPILLCERSERFARGTAYGTGIGEHLLNVRASNMSAYPDRPDDFLRWLDRAGRNASPEVHATPAGTFVSRHLYGSYLASLLEEAVATRDGAARLILVPDEVTDLWREGDGFRLVLAGGRRPQAAAVVIAAGNLLPTESGDRPIVTNPWASRFTEELDPARPVVVIGSGLTMVDVALQLRRAGFGGNVIAISRRGQLPHSHAMVPSWALPVLTTRERTSPAHLLGRLRREAVRAEAGGADWRSVVDSLRPITSDLWHSFDRSAQGRFLRHARPWWDIHRHRMAVPVGREIEELVGRGVLEVRAGQVQRIAAGSDGAEVYYRPRGQEATAVVAAQRVIHATGARAPDRCDNTLIEQLIMRGLARLDCHRLGLDLTEGCGVRDAGGRTVDGLWALGPLGQGVFWECTAVPDIRNQAVRVAKAVADLLAERRPGATDKLAEADGRAVPAHS